jgi:hypothetical protein
MAVFMSTLEVVTSLSWRGDELVLLNRIIISPQSRTCHGYTNSTITETNRALLNCLGIIHNIICIKSPARQFTSPYMASQ